MGPETVLRGRLAQIPERQLVGATLFSSRVAHDDLVPARRRQDPSDLFRPLLKNRVYGDKLFAIRRGEYYLQVGPSGSNYRIQIVTRACMRLVRVCLARLDSTIERLSRLKHFRRLRRQAKRKPEQNRGTSHKWVQCVITPCHGSAEHFHAARCTARRVLTRFRDFG